MILYYGSTMEVSQPRILKSEAAVILASRSIPRIFRRRLNVGPDAVP